MIIQSSNIAMSSQRTYRSIEARSASYSGWGKTRNLGTKGSLITAATLPQAKDSMQETVVKRNGKDAKQSFFDLEQKGVMKGGRLFKTGEGRRYRGSDQVGFRSFSNLMELLLKSDADFGKGRFSELFGMVQQGQRSWSSDSSLVPTQMWGMEYKESYYYEEHEETSFYSSGTVKTADGRSIEFDISALMSRSFAEYASVEIDYGAAYMVDPLVINLDTDMAEVREQKFLFDIDADGELDNISMLSEACGYLALDKNGDGVVNDGSELFGTSTGNGFEELAVFDMDGNGWIDENDEIFNKLRIWTKDAEGKDKLVGLGIAGVGAIYLGNLGTKFNLNSSQTNQTNAQVRSTGIYLKESGEVGTIQHVDMAAG